MVSDSVTQMTQESVVPEILAGHGPGEAEPRGQPTSSDRVLGESHESLSHRRSNEL